MHKSYVSISADDWWCIWNVNDKAWTIGWDSFNELNKAFKKVNI